jgi:hypothetical protein
MALVDIRKIVVSVESTYHEGGPRRAEPLLIGSALAVVANPYAGRFEADVMPFMTELRSLGAALSKRLLDSLGGPAGIEAYGKGAIVAEDGELEHGALWHEAGGWALRESLGGRLAIVPSAKTIGSLGTRLIVPLGHTNAAYVRSHFGSAEIGLWDGPRRGEILFGLCASTGGRIHARAGGMLPSDIKVNDGQR